MEGSTEKIERKPIYGRSSRLPGIVVFALILYLSSFVQPVPAWEPYFVSWLSWFLFILFVFVYQLWGFFRLSSYCSCSVEGDLFLILFKSKRIELSLNDIESVSIFYSTLDKPKGLSTLCLKSKNLTYSLHGIKYVEEMSSSVLRNIKKGNES